MHNTIEYPCHGYHDSLAKGKASGMLRIGASSFEFSIGDKRGIIPIEGAEVKLGGAGDRLVFITHPAVPKWTLYTHDLSILKNPRLQEFPVIKASLARAKNKRKVNWSILAIVATLLVAVPLVAFLRMDSLTKHIAAEIPPAWEYKLGESSMAQYRLSHNFLDSERSDALLKPLLSPLLKALAQNKTSRRYEYRFSIVNDSSLNAFALPGGFVVIHSGLIVKAGSGEELLGVLAHEIIHVEQQHGVRNIISSLGIYLTLSAVLGDVEGVLASLAGAAPLLLTQSYSRKFEKQADTLAHELLQKAGIDPSGLATFFTKMVAEEQARLAEVEDEDTRALIKEAMRFLSSHPTSEDRIAYLQALSKDADGSNIDLSQTFGQLQKSVKLYILENQHEEPRNASKD